MKSLLILATSLTVSVSCFVKPPTAPRCVSETTRFTSCPQGLGATAQKTTLTEDTTWKLRFLLNGIPTEKGKKVDQLFVVDAQFVEEEGYEPPQGYLKQVDSAGDGFTIVKSRWVLSEDPDDRKDGLWVWGLFKEPLYPYMLLQLETEKCPLPGEGGDVILPLQLFAQIDHSRDNEKGVILRQASLQVREVETINADPFGVSKVDVYDEKTVGQLTIQPQS